MFLFKQGLTTFVLLCYYVSSQAAELRDDLIKVNIERNNENKSIVAGTLFSTDASGYPFAICKTTIPNVEKICQVKLIDKPQNDRICDGVKVFTNDTDRELFLGGYFQIIPFTKDHVIVVWYDQTKRNISPKKHTFHVKILNMENCKTVNLEYPVDNADYGSFPSLLLYSNQVNVIVNSKKDCHGATKCRLVYNLDGEQIGGVMPYKEVMGYSSPVSLSSPDKGYFVSVQDKNTLRVLLVQTNGEGKLLSTDHFESDAVDQRVSFSSAHEKYTICRMPDTKAKGPSKIYCEQYDNKGQSTIDNKSVITFPEVVHWLSVRSLSEDGFLVASSGCDVTQSAVDCPNFRVWRVHSNGKIDKPVKIEGPTVSCNDMSLVNMKSNLQVRIIEDEKDRFCFDFGCLNDNVNLTYLRKCVPKSHIVSK